MGVWAAGLREPRTESRRGRTEHADSWYTGIVPFAVAMVGVTVMLDAPRWLLGLAEDRAVTMLDVAFGLLVVLYAVWLSYRDSSRRER